MLYSLLLPVPPPTVIETRRNLESLVSDEPLDYIQVFRVFVIHLLVLGINLSSYSTNIPITVGQSTSDIYRIWLN